MNSYKTIFENLEFEISPIKKSRFIPFVYKVASHEEVLEAIDNAKIIYPGANHYCWAYSLVDNNQLRFSDDGEPQSEILIEYDYSETANVDNLLNRYNIQIIRENYSNLISKVIKICTSEKSIFLEEITNITKGRVQVIEY